MIRYLLFAALLVCSFHTFQATPLPQDAQQPASNELDRLAERAKEVWNNAKTTIEGGMDQLMKNPTINDAIEKTKSFFNQAGDTLRKEAEKIGDQIRD